MIMSGTVSPQDNPAKDPELQAASGRGIPDGSR